jgi:hypothetical protein
VSTAATGCLPFLCAPDGPDTPFGSFGLAVLDSGRALVWLLGLFVIAKALATIYYIRNPRQRAVYIALAFGAFLMIGTEWEHFGDYANYRLFATLAFMGAASYGLARIELRVRDWDDHDADDDEPDEPYGAHAAYPEDDLP